MDAMIATICNSVVEGMKRDFGPLIIVELLNAIDRNMGIHTDISGSQMEVESMLFERHGSFDSDIWLKVQNTKAWRDYHEKLYSLSIRYLNQAIDEVVQQEVQGTA